MKMPETQEQFRVRMQASGKWPEFLAYRQALEKHDREPRDAWIEAARAFGFEGHYSQSSRKKAKAEANPVVLVQDAPKELFAGKPPGSVRGDFQWVYSNLGVLDVTAEDCPSSGAWGLLEYARTEPREFYKSWMSMVSRSVDTDEKLEGFRSDATKSVAEIAEMLRSLEGAASLRDGPEGDAVESGVPEGCAGESGLLEGGAEGPVGGLCEGPVVLGEHVRLDVRPEEAEPEATVHNV
jgi:hypothetical protein